MKYRSKSAVNNPLLPVFLAGVFLICFLGSFISQKPLLMFPNFRCVQLELTDGGSVEKVDELDTALRRASLEAKGTVIITVVNRAYVERDDGVLGPTMLDLFVESLWIGERTRGLLDNLLIVAVDRTAYERCVFRRLNCYRLETAGVDFGGEKLYMSEDFIRMMWRRTLFLLDVLRRGYSFIFTDTDIMWLRNPLQRLSSNGSEDLQISTDGFNGDSKSEMNYINTGLYYVQSNNKTVSLFELWHASRNRFPGKKEQDVLLELMDEGAFTQLGLSVRYLDTLYFSGFCQDSKDIRAVATVHANCCQSISAKLVDLSTVLNGWKIYKKFSIGTTILGNGSDLKNKGTVYRVPWFRRHIACLNSWKGNHKTTNAIA